MVDVKYEEDILRDLRIVDCDSHMTESPDLWTSRVPASFKDRVPVMQTFEGKSGWYLDGNLWSSVGGNTIATGGKKRLGIHIIQPFSDVAIEAWQVKGRLSLMDSMGIHAAILYPNAVGFSANHIFDVDDLSLRRLILQTYNDYFVEIQDESGDRLFPQALLPIWDMDFTIDEMARLLDRGIRGFTISDKPELLGLPELPDSYFTPMWDLANHADAVMNFHIGAGRTRNDRWVNELVNKGFIQGRDTVWSSFSQQRTMAISSAQSFMSNVRIVANLCMSDLFDRFPRLRIVSAESGIGWIPFLLEALEYELDDIVTDPSERRLQKLRPTEYFKNHMYGTFWFETVGPEKLIEDVGVNNVMVETDIPHPTCLYPNAREHFCEIAERLEAAIRRRVFQDNAVELYRIPLPE